MIDINWFIFFRDIAIFFASIMLFKYTVYLVIAPFYSLQEMIRKARIDRDDKHSLIKNYKVSVIIPAFNEEVGVVKTINSVINNSYRNMEVIIVNDGSTDNTETVIRKYIDDLRITNPTSAEKITYVYKDKGGKGKALNKGISIATGEIIITLDADSTLEENALKNLVRYFKDPKLSAVVGNVIIANNKTFIGLIQSLEYLFGFYFKRSHAVLGAEYIFGGACAAFRAKIFNTIGTFDEENKTEDIEMSMRIRSYGYKCTYAEDVICYTEGASSIEGLVNQRLRWKKGRFTTFWKHRNLFFSYKHNKSLSYFVLPFSILSELQLLFEPISISLLAAYSFVANDYLSLFLGLMFIFVIYLVNGLFSYRGINLKLLLYFPFTWPYFYLLEWIEYIALLQSLRMLIRGQEVEWQAWKREGVALS
jgi:cellulose synthase/poly-beta-1,6-N-acetylglucosamine synthase-like glycosyltransferase